MEEPIKITEGQKYIRKCPGPRYKVVSGPGGHYVYDFKSLDVVKKDGKFFMTSLKGEAIEFFHTLNDEAPVAIPRNFYHGKREDR